MLCIIWLLLMGVTEETARPAAMGLLGTCGAAFASATALAFDIRRHSLAHKSAIVLLLTSICTLLGGLHWKVFLLLSRATLPAELSLLRALDLSSVADALSPPPVPEKASIHLALACIVLLELSLVSYVLVLLAVAGFTCRYPQACSFVPLCEGALTVWTPLCLAMIIWALAPALTARADETHGSEPFGALLASGLTGLVSPPGNPQSGVHSSQGHAFLHGAAQISSGMRVLWLEMLDATERWAPGPV